MYGDPLKRIAPLRYSVEGLQVVVRDGNDNIAGKIQEVDGAYQVVYSTPSIRLAAGPNTTFLDLGTYYSLEDAKKILQLHENCETIAVFAPGRIVGWIDKEKTIRLKDAKSGLWKIFHFIKRLFSTKK